MYQTVLHKGYAIKGHSLEIDESQLPEIHHPGTPVTNVTAEAACLGAEILAGVGAGVWTSVVETAEKIADYDLEYLPNGSHKALYDGMLNEYKQLMVELSPAFKRCA